MKDPLEKIYSTTLERNFVNWNNRKEDIKKFPSHWERYYFAANFVKNKKVQIVDVACGSGYGTDILSKSTGKQAIGLDKDDGAILWANYYYGNRSKFLKINSERWPIEDKTVDVVVSFETIEHINDVNKFLLEIKRILKENGLIIISTPLNEEINRFKPENPFHLREYNWEEFGNLISNYFIIKSRFSQISRLGDLNQKITNSPFNFIKRIIPRKIKNFIIKILSQKSEAKKGKILPGFVFGAGVQIIVARKI